MGQSKIPDRGIQDSGQRDLPRHRPKLQLSARLLTRQPANTRACRFSCQTCRASADDFSRPLGTELPGPSASFGYRHGLSRPCASKARRFGSTSDDYFAFYHGDESFRVRLALNGRNASIRYIFTSMRSARLTGVRRQHHGRHPRGSRLCASQHRKRKYLLLHCVFSPSTHAVCRTPRAAGSPSASSLFSSSRVPPPLCCISSKMQE